MFGSSGLYGFELPANVRLVGCHIFPNITLQFMFVVSLVGWYVNVPCFPRDNASVGFAYAYVASSCCLPSYLKESLLSQPQISGCTQI
jgi:hypothetical protein